MSDQNLRNWPKIGSIRFDTNITEFQSQAIVPTVSFNVRKAKILAPFWYQVIMFEHVIQKMEELMMMSRAYLLHHITGLICLQSKCVHTKGSTVTLFL